MDYIVAHRPNGGQLPGEIPVQRTMEETFLLALATRAVAMVTWVLAVTHVFMMMGI
jgi:type IV secretory pathway TrbD component